MIRVTIRRDFCGCYTAHDPTGREVAFAISSAGMASKVATPPNARHVDLSRVKLGGSVGLDLPDHHPIFGE